MLKFDVMVVKSLQGAGQVIRADLVQPQHTTRMQGNPLYAFLILRGDGSFFTAWSDEVEVVMIDGESV